MSLASPYFAPRSGWVYAALIKRTGLIKIGFTEDLYHRMVDLRHRCRSEVELLGLLSETIAHEQGYHHRFQASRAEIPGSTEREFYHDTPDIQAFIQSMQRPESVSVKLPKAKPYQPQDQARYQLTDRRVNGICDMYLSTSDQHARLNHLNKLQTRLRWNQTHGFAIDSLVQIIRDRLGADSAERVVAGVRV